MTGVNKTARSTAAAAANTDTTIYTPPAGQRVRILSFSVLNEGAAGSAFASIELRYPAAGTILAITGLGSATPAIGAMSNPQVVNHEIIGDGTSAIVGRNVQALQASEVLAYTVALEVSPGA
jgi:hypothetical protein